MERTARAVAAALLLASIATPTTAATCPSRATRVEPGTWEAKTIDAIEGAPFTWDMTADEKDPRFVVVTDRQGILVTRDGGCRWSRALSFEEPLPGSPISVEDLAIAGSGPGRSAHVLLRPSSGEPRVLVSSYDDGETWQAEDLPVQTALPMASTAALASGPGDGALYLLADAGAGVAGVFVRADREASWQWTALSTPVLPAGECAPDGPCTTVPLWRIQADPSHANELWGLGATEATGETGLRRSGDGGISWEDNAVPDLLQRTILFDVAPRPGTTHVLLLGGLSEFAFSSDAGRSWQVGRLPKLVSSTWTSAGVFDVAHFDRGRSFATVLGNGTNSPWAGNVFVFDGRKWANASPPEFAGYDRPHTFAALASTSGRLLAVSSRGELMSFSR